MRDVIDVLLGSFGAAIIVALLTLAWLKLVRHAATRSTAPTAATLHCKAPPILEETRVRY